MVVMPKRPLPIAAKVLLNTQCANKAGGQVHVMTTLFQASLKATPLRVLYAVMDKL